MSPMTFKRFSYRTYAGDGGSPSVEVELLGINGAVIPHLALLDTGAEWSKMPLELGRRMGVDLDRCHLTQSQTGGGIASGEYFWNDSPEGCEREEPVVRLMGREVPIAPILSEHIDVVVLGRNDFLASFKLCVDQRAHSFTLEPYDEPLADWFSRSSGP
jgi:hypothetical protein